MRFENGRGMPLTIALAAAIGLGQGWVGTTRADGYRLHHTIPRSVPAVNLSTGQEFMAPPVPYGHYAKDSVLGCASCQMHKLLGCVGCGHGPGSGCHKGLFGHDGDGSNCVGPDCGGGHGWGKHSSAGRFAPIDCDSDCFEPGCGGGHWKGKHHNAPTAVLATTQSPPVGIAVVQPTGQALCGDPGCEISGKHHHGKGLHESRGGRGHGCSFCGGKGCSHCLSGLHSKLGMLTGLLHRQKVDYFVGRVGRSPSRRGTSPTSWPRGHRAISFPSRR